MRILIFTILFIYLNVNAANICENRLFSLSAYSGDSKRGISVEDVLKDLSMQCGLTISFEDKKSKDAIKKKLDFINIQNYTFDEFIDFLFDESNLFYKYDKTKNIIKVSYYKSETFNIDYINVSELSSESSKSINTGSGGGVSNSYGSTATTSSYGTGTTNSRYGSSGGTSADYTKIVTKSEFTFWKSLRESIEKLLSGSKDYKLFINKDASLLTVRANKKDLENIRKFLDSLMKKMHKQVLIEAKIIEVVYNDNYTKGIDWSKFNLSLSGSISGFDTKLNGTTFSNLTKPDYYIGYNFSTEGLINFLKTYGDVNILSNPKVLTLNNQPAVINVGEQLSYKYQTGGISYTTTGTPVGTTTYSLGSTFVGITLYVIPEVSSQDSIIMKINPVISELIENQELNTTQRELPPDIKIKQMTSIVKVKDGQKVLIGGLISLMESKYHKKVPILGDLPLLGRAFHSTQDIKKRSELFILLVPKIVKSSNMPTIDEVKIFKGRKFE